jgi:uncharacterized membrane protein YeaQ/YmgE (transglycosylase-associated protein family)
MTITVDTGLFTLLVAGLISGTASAAVTAGMGRVRGRWLRNIIIGVLGAILGVFLFDALNLLDELPSGLSETISLAELFIAFVGGVILILLVRFIRL